MDKRKASFRTGAWKRGGQSEDGSTEERIGSLRMGAA
jgi:hypothetical protein